MHKYIYRPKIKGCNTLGSSGHQITIGFLVWYASLQLSTLQEDTGGRADCQRIPALEQRIPVSSVLAWFCLFPPGRGEIRVFGSCYDLYAPSLGYAAQSFRFPPSCLHSLSFFLSSSSVPLSLFPVRHPPPHPSPLSGVYRPPAVAVNTVDAAHAIGP